MSSGSRSEDEACLGLLEHGEGVHPRHAHGIAGVGDENSLFGERAGLFVGYNNVLVRVGVGNELKVGGTEEGCDCCRGEGCAGGPLCELL